MANKPKTSSIEFPLSMKENTSFVSFVRRIYIYYYIYLAVTGVVIFGIFKISRFQELFDAAYEALSTYVWIISPRYQGLRDYDIASANIYILSIIFHIIPIFIMTGIIVIQFYYKCVRKKDFYPIDKKSTDGFLISLIISISCLYLIYIHNPDFHEGKYMGMKVIFIGEMSIVIDLLTAAILPFFIASTIVYVIKKRVRP